MNFSVLPCVGYLLIHYVDESNILSQKGKTHRRKRHCTVSLALM